MSKLIKAIVDKALGIAIKIIESEILNSADRASAYTAMSNRLRLRAAAQAWLDARKRG